MDCKTNQKEHVKRYSPRSGREQSRKTVERQHIVTLHSSLRRDHCGVTMFYFSHISLPVLGSCWKRWELSLHLPHWGILGMCPSNSCRGKQCESRENKMSFLVMPCLPTHVSVHQLGDGSSGWGFLSPRLGSISEPQRISDKQPEVSC